MFGRALITPFKVYYKFPRKVAKLKLQIGLHLVISGQQQENI